MKIHVQSTVDLRNGVVGLNVREAVVLGSKLDIELATNLFHDTGVSLVMVIL